MKSYILLSFWLLFLSVSQLNAQQPSDENLVLTNERKFNDLQMQRKCDQAAALLAESFQSTEGPPESKSDFLQSCKKGEIIWNSIKMSKVQVRLHTPTMAIVSYRDDFDCILQGRPANGRLLENSVWLKQDGKWLMHFHTSTSDPMAVTEGNKIRLLYFDADHKQDELPASGQVKDQEKELIRLEKQWAEALGDSAYLSRITSDDYVIVDASGDVRNKQQELTLARSEKFETSTVDDLSVRIYGNSAVVLGRYSLAGTVMGQPYKETGRFTDVWVNYSGNWRVVSTQNTSLPPPSAQPPADSFFIEMERGVWEALKNKDKAADARLLADDFVGLYDTGFATKSDHVNQMDSKYSIESYSVHDARVFRLSPTIVLLLYKAICKGSGEWEQYCSRPDFASSLWVERDGRWLNLFSQDTGVTSGK
jgi:hypothetical protein